MDEKHVTALLKTLTPREKVVLSLLCQDLRQKQIALKLGISLKAVEYHMGNIYGKLGLDDEKMGKSQRRSILLVEFCPVLALILAASLKTPGESLVQTAENETLGESSLISVPLEPEDPPEPTAKALAIVEHELMQEEEEGVSSPPPPSTPAIPYISEGEANRRTIRAIILFALVVVIIAGIYWLRYRPLATALAALTPTATSGVISEINSQTSVPVILPASLATQTQTALPFPTATNPPATPIAEPTLTATVTITPMPTPAVLFADDFDNGLSPQWAVWSGKPFINDGQLAANDPTWLSVGDPSWTNIKVEYDTYMSDHSDCYPEAFPQRQYTTMFGFKVQDMDNLLALKTGQCGFMWFVVQSGNWVHAAGQSGPGPGPRIWATLTILIEGNKYTAYVNGKKSTSFVDNTYSTGKLALLINKDTLVDNFSVVALP